MDTKHSHEPPKLAIRFLEWYCNPEKLEEIEGDAYELFNLNLQEKGLSYARWKFIWHVITFFRWSNIRRRKPTYQSYTQAAMFKSYFKLGWRNLRNQKLTTFISVFGLSTAVACSLVAYLFTEQIWFKGVNQKNKNELYQIVYKVEQDEGIVTKGTIAEPAYELLNASSSKYQGLTRVWRGSNVLIHNNETYFPRTQFVDSDYMEMFSYDIQSGYSGALEDPTQVILSSEFAERLFGDSPAIGQEISLVIAEEEKFFKVAAVLEPLKDIEIFEFEVLARFDLIWSKNEDLILQDQWKKECWTFIQLKNESELANLKSTFDQIQSSQNRINLDQPYLEISTIPFTELVPMASKIDNGVIGFMGQGPIILLATIAGFILVLAIFNYVNISILMATKRLKEIGVRKVIGVSRFQLILQYLSENFLVCLGAIVFGCLIASAFFLPGFNSIAFKNLQLDLLGNWMVWAWLGALLLFLTIASGIYPAIYISSFKPITILKQKAAVGKKGWITQTLLTLQFTLAIIGIIGGLAFVQTNAQNAEREWGYDSENKIILNVPDPTKFQVLENQIQNNSKVISTAGSNSFIGNWINTNEMKVGDTEISTQFLLSDPDYLTEMGVELLTGQSLDELVPADHETSILVNETFVKESGLLYPIESIVEIDSVDHRIVGVVKDFHTIYFQSEVEPMVMKASNTKDFDHLTLSFSAGNDQEAMEEVRAIWREIFPKDLFTGQFQSQVFDGAINDARGVQNVLLVAAGLCIILAAMGLFGLVSLNLKARIKDYCVRKVYGAGTPGLAVGLVRRYLLLGSLSAVLGGGLAWYAVGGFLDSFFAFHSGVGLFPVGVSIALLFIVVLLTGAYQMIYLNKANPSVVLKSE
ncbi:FtsX-like permease family protein [Algoriphagus sediminis]|uniref:Permease prefix domain 2-containing transporter n=1 Tax=Algoriphagus sediminis TaxID=3057113 RepID=A0ABT7YAW4_9BACT|nr:FtsX-like permease family protein [Algoriphagus sediminis]MDN3203339.1 permease prefix domain 2-containing transporter [Algoriphagus sediminis]